MANFTAHLSASGLNGIPPNRPSWLGSPTVLVTTADGHVTNTFLTGTLNRNAPSYLAANYTAHLGGSYSDIFYNRILLEPANLDLGNLVADQTRNVTIFNGHFDARTLSNVVITGADGLTLTGDLPPPDVSFGALEDKTYVLTVDTVGPPDISASYEFDFTAPTEDVTLTITGSRIVALPYYFSAPMTESLSWLTNLIVSRDGTEQRIRLRNAPRQQFSAQAFISKDELNRVDNLFYGWRKRLWALPVWSEARIASTVTSGDQVILVDTRFGDFRTGELAMIWSNPRKFDVFEILSFTDTQINLDRGVNDTYHSASVIPVRIGRLLSNPSRNTNGTNGFIQVSFEVMNNIVLPELVPPGGEIFNNIDVYLEEPLLDPDFIEDRYNHRIDVQDYDTGLVEIFAPWTYTKINRQFRFVLENLEDVWNFKRWLSRRGGRQTPFWMPTFENNLRLISEGLLLISIEVKSDEIVGQAESRTHVAINTKSAGWSFHTVSSYQINAEGNTDVVFTAALNINSNDVIVISFMGQKRLASDRIEINWLPNCVAEVVLPITEVEP